MGIDNIYLFCLKIKEYVKTGTCQVPVADTGTSIPSPMNTGLDAC